MECGRGGALTGKTVLLTGATGGIGLDTAHALAALGAHVVVGARDAIRGAAVADDIVRNGGLANVLAVDLSSLQSVRDASARFLSAYSQLDVLINNAGIIAAKREISRDGHELTWATNFLGLFALTQMLLPALHAAPEPRVVNVSSDAHKWGRLRFDDLETERGRFSGMRAYAQSKLALVLYTREFAGRYPDVAANAVHPGAIATGIWRAGPPIVRTILAAILPPSAKGAAPVVRLASAPDVRGITGRYFDRLRDATPSIAAQSDADGKRLWTYAESATAEGRK